MKRLLKIVSTNWIHLIGFLITAYLSGILFKAIGLETAESWPEVLIQSIWTIPLAIILYGIPILAGFYILIAVMDFLSFKFANIKTEAIVVIEWIIMSAPFWYWSFKFEFWIWIPLSISLLITQLIRVNWIDKYRNKVGATL